MIAKKKNQKKKKKKEENKIENNGLNKKIMGFI